MLVSAGVPVLVRPLKAARSRAVVAMGVLLALGVATNASAQAEIKVNEDVNLRFGVLGQFQADTIDNPLTGPEHEQLVCVRRLRLMRGGNVAKNVSFFVETDVPNLWQDAAEWEEHQCVGDRAGRACGSSSSTRRSRSTPG